MISITLENFADLLSKAVAEYGDEGEADYIRLLFSKEKDKTVYELTIDSLIFKMTIRCKNVPIRSDDTNCIINGKIVHDDTTIFQCNLMRVNIESAKALFDSMLKRYE